MAISMQRKWLRLQFLKTNRAILLPHYFSIWLKLSCDWVLSFFHPNSVQGEEICTLSYFSCISSHYFYSKDEFSWRFYENKLLSWISYTVNSLVSEIFEFLNFERIKVINQGFNAMYHIRFHRKSFTQKTNQSALKPLAANPSWSSDDIDVGDGCRRQNVLVKI